MPTLSTVQAHQKDNQTEAVLSLKVEGFLKNLKGQLFTNAHPQEISIFVKLFYLGLTTLMGNKTLGEEYVDLMYVSRNGKSLVRRYRKLLFILSYAGGPYLMSKFLKRWNTNDSDEESNTRKFSRKRLLNLILNLHLVLFYFKGAYYDIFKRIFGLRYAIGHRVDINEAKFRKSSSNTYRFLGYILLLQITSKGMPIIIRHVKKSLKGSPSNNVDGLKGHNEKNDHLSDVISGIPDNTKVLHIDLSDDSELPFIPSSSRTCILCLNPMTDPSCAPCGHLFCWNCIINWCKERPECPLCRQKCFPQQVLSLR